eukprot:COSAG06_NODE_8244_length_2219_cov_1.708843_3_plen_218_part_00
MRRDIAAAATAACCRHLNVHVVAILQEELQTQRLGLRGAWRGCEQRGTGCVRGSRGRGSAGLPGLYQNKEFMRYVKMDVLDFSYLYDVGPLDALIYNAAIHAYTFDPHVYGRMLEYTLPILELAAGGEPARLWYVTSGHVSGKKHPHNSKPYMHELQNDVRFGVFDDIARELCALRGWSVLEAYGMSVVGKAKDALHLDLDDATLIRDFLAHYVLLQ